MDQMPDLQNQEIKKKNWVKSTLKIFSWIILSLFLFFTAMVSLVFFYEDEVKAAIIKELNTHLNAQIVVQPENIELSLFKTFPNASLNFQKVLCYEALDKPKKDTLFYTDKIGLQFNLLDLYHEKYDIKALEIENAKVYLRVDKKGIENYIIWKEVSASADSTNVKFEIENVRLSEVFVSYKNKMSGLKLEADIESASLNGNFSEAQFSMSTESKFFLKEFYFQGKTWLKNKSIAAEFGMDVNNEKYLFKDADLKINEMKLAIKGKLQKEKDKLWADLSFVGKDLDIQSTMSLLPGAQRDKIKDYESTGNFYANGILKGDLFQSNSLLAKINFGVQNADVEYTPNNLRVEKINLQGKWEIGKQELLELKGILAEIKGQKISADFSLRKFDNPEIDLRFNGSIGLSDLLSFYPIDTIQSAGGMMDVNLALKGNLKSLQDDFSNENNFSEGSISLKNLDFKFKDNPKETRVESGEINFNNRNISINQLKVFVGHSDFTVAGEAKNLVSWLIKENQILLVKGDLQSEFIDLDDFLYSEKSNSPQVPLVFSDKLEIQVGLKVKKLSMGKFVSKEISGKINFKDRKIYGEEVQGTAMGGTIKSTGIFDLSEESDFRAKGTVVFDKIDIKELFYQLNNFGQKTLTDNNLKGLFSSTLDFKASWDKSLKVIPGSIKIQSEVSIEKGQLIDFKPLESLSKYIELKELQNIRFNTLKSKIEIENSEIQISKTQLDNSALNLEIFGKQDFKNNIDFHLKMLLSEVLAKKPRKNKTLDQQLQEVEDDPSNKRCVFLHLTGTYDNPIITFDKKGMKEKIKEDIKQEKQSLKQILNEEFGLFKKDSTLKKTKEIKPETKFEIEFGKDSKSNKGKTIKKESPEEDEDF